MSSRTAASTLQKVGDLLYAVKPKAIMSLSSHSPCAVMVHGWMDAEIKHVAKYAQPYIELFPNATVLVQLSTVRSAFLTSVPGGQSDTDLALSLLHEAQNGASASLPDVQPTVIFHSFSNGGMMPLHTLLQLGCKSQRKLPKPMAYIMDCSPGHLDGDKFAQVMAKMAPTDSYAAQIRHWATRNATRVLFNGLTSYADLRKIENPLELVKRNLNETSTWAWGSEPQQLPPRLYTYTAADPFIDPKYVYQHAEQASVANGTPVPEVLSMENLTADQVRISDNPIQLCRWETAKHCAIARSNPQTYWKAIQDFLKMVAAKNVSPQAKL
ncbi:hypothetical protein MYAM1_000778 [Malassezia yamatoensis]|uniref:Uncharacterized protein n=1 Tax=Malassezia yamatoensis TaxID=253288 RepID=A0AAJ5YQ38_9BASI|nr:hypothetical protein MYAM1_000778 [Malassezia yamatoensis]